MEIPLEKFSRLEQGAGQLLSNEAGIQCTISASTQRIYHNAQLYDYANKQRAHYPHQPLVSFSVTAWFESESPVLAGTAGFGFWNNPLVFGIPRLPRYAWFFYGGPPMNMALAKGVPGYGWKAAIADFRQPAFLALAPFAPLGFLLMRNRALYERLWPIGQRAIGAAEALIPYDMRTPHHYALEWQGQTARFWVDDQLMLQTPYAPSGPLGFVAWMDNQYAILTPQGHFGWGVTEIRARQTLHLQNLRIKSLHSRAVEE
jgi:hypothetical protein